MTFGELKIDHDNTIYCVYDSSFRVDLQCSRVEKDVVIWAKTQDVADRVGAVVWLPEWFDVRGFRVRSGRRHQLLAADLTSVVVEALRFRRYGRISHESLDCSFDPSYLAGYI